MVCPAAVRPRPRCRARRPTGRRSSAATTETMATPKTGTSSCRGSHGRHGHPSRVARDVGGRRRADRRRCRCGHCRWATVAGWRGVGVGGGLAHGRSFQVNVGTRDRPAWNAGRSAGGSGGAAAVDHTGTTRMAITPAATKAAIAAMPAIIPMVDQAYVDSSRPRSVSPLKRVLRWPVMVSALACNSSTVAWGAPLSVAVWTAALAARSGCRGRHRWRRRPPRRGGRRCSWRRPRRRCRWSPAGRRGRRGRLGRSAWRAAASGNEMFCDDSSRPT